VDIAGNVYIADPANSRIRMVNPAGIISTFAGNGTPFATGSLGNGDGGPPPSASVSTPYGVKVDSAGKRFSSRIPVTAPFERLPGAAGASGPTISANGVVNGASFQPGIVANSWVTIQGAGLAAKTDDWSNSIVNGVLPASLDGVSVTMGGKPAYVYYISPGQLNVLAPDVPAGTHHRDGDDGLRHKRRLRVPRQAHTARRFFVWPGNQAVATRTDYSYAVKPGTFAGATTVAAKPGDVIILWATGFGPTNPAAPTGVAVPSDKSYATGSLPGITIDNVAATVYGAAPGARLGRLVSDRHTSSALGRRRRLAHPGAHRRSSVPQRGPSSQSHR